MQKLESMYQGDEIYNCIRGRGMIETSSRIMSSSSNCRGDISACV
jgi:hypothetical protein